MLPPKIRLNGKFYDLELTDEPQNPGFSASLGYVVKDSEKDLKVAYIVIVVGGTTLSGWIGSRAIPNEEVRKKVKDIVTATLPYIDIPLSLEQIREQYPKGFQIFYINDNRDGYRETEFSFYSPESYNPIELVKRVVYGGDITPDKIEDRTLRLLEWYKEWDYTNQQQPNPSTTKGEIFYPDLLALSFVPEDQLKLALDLLNEEGLIEVRKVDQGDIIGVQIKALGIRKLRSPSDSTPPESRPKSYNYVSRDIINRFANKKDGFNYSKLISLLEELNDNWEHNKPYATASSLRAVLDHIPPLLAQRTWDGVASSHQWERTNKKYIEQLHDSRAISDDSLHRAIGRKT